MCELPHQRCLREMQPYLVRNLVVTDALDHVLASGCLSDDDREQIDAVLGDRAQIRVLLQILRRKEYKAFHALLQGLTENACHFVVAALEDKMEEILMDVAHTEKVTLTSKGVLLIYINLMNAFLSCVKVWDNSVRCLFDVDGLCCKNRT